MLTVAQLARDTGISEHALRWRIYKRGLSTAEAVAWGQPAQRRWLNPYALQDAKMLGLSRSTILMRMAVYKLDEDAALAIGPARAGGRYSRLKILDLTNAPDLAMTARDDTVYGPNGEVICTD